MYLLPSQKVGDLPKNLDAEGERTSVICVADVGAKEVVSVLCPAVAELTQGDYVIIPNKAGATVAYWFDIDADGTAPSGAAYTAADTKTKVSVTTGQTAVQVATALAAATAPTAVTRARVDATVTFSNTLIGTCVDAAAHNEDDSGVGSFVVAVVTQGAASALQNKYFVVNTPAPVSYYVWFNVGAEGVDPSVVGKTGVAVAISPSATAAAIAAAMVAALNLVGSGAVFLATRDDATVYVNDIVTGNATDAGVGNAGLTVATVRQGVSKMLGSVGSLNSEMLNSSIATVSPAT